MIHQCAFIFSEIRQQHGCLTIDDMDEENVELLACLSYKAGLQVSGRNYTIILCSVCFKIVVSSFGAPGHMSSLVDSNSATS